MNIFFKEFFWNNIKLLIKDEVEFLKLKEKLKIELLNVFKNNKDIYNFNKM